MPGIDANTKLCLHCDGANGSTSFSDSSQYGHTVTANSPAQVSTSQSKFGGASASFNGVAAALKLDGSADFTFGAGDFTVDFWFYVTTSAPSYQILFDGRPNATNGAYPTIFLNGSVLSYNANTAVQITGGSPSLNAWHHVAVARSSGSTKMFLDGTQTGATYTDATNYLSGGASRPGFGSDSSNNYTVGGLSGFIDEIRISNVARWTANFTPPTAAYESTTAMAASTVAFTLTGFAAKFQIRTPESVGAFALTGIAAILTPTAVAVAASYTLSRPAVQFVVTMAEAVGNYALTGNAVALAPTAVAGVGSYALTGFGATFLDTLSASVTSYALIGDAAIETPQEALQPGSYAWTGFGVRFSYDIDLGGVGGRIAGGQFTRGRWREIVEAEQRAREAALKEREQEEARKREAWAAEAQRAKAAAQARRAAEDQANTQRAHQQAVIDALAAVSGAHTIADAMRRDSMMSITAHAAHTQQLANQEEEDAIMHLLLLS